MTAGREAAELRRSIGLFPATAMVVGIIVGASIFVQPSLITGQVPSIPGVFAVWAIAGGLTLIGSLVAAELSSAYPRTGGVYVFLREAFSPALGFLWGWAMFWIMHSGIVAAISMVFARYVAYFVPLDDVGLRLVAIGAIVVLSAINAIGVQYGAAVQTGFTAVKLVAIVLVIVLGLWVGIRGGLPQEPATATATADLSIRGFVVAIIAGLFAFGGWHMVTYAAGETVDPERTIPKALIIGTLLVTVCYIALNAAYFAVLPMATVSSSTRVAADFADAVMGSGAAAMSALVILSTIGAVNGVILAGPRVYLSMAHDGLLFGWIGAVHPRFRTPHRAILLQAVWSAVLVGTGTYRQIFTRVVYTEWIFFGLMAAAVFVFRRRPGYSPPYRMWGYPVLPLIFIVATALIVLNQIISEPAESATGLLLVLAGLPVYYFWIKRRTPGRNAR